jgi:NAD(P)-dependent dehydrogenase (short-subunit alcohol dehydrogenase family)
MRIEGRGALVTGASRGLGVALARALAREGARVVLVARGREELERVAAEIRAAGGEAHAVVADVADKEAVYPLAGTAAALAGPIDLLVQNASTLGPLPLPCLLDTACEDLARVLEVNLVGPFRLAKAVVGPMVLRGRGLVVNITSDAAVSAYRRWGAYGVSKAALDHLGRIFAAELEGTGVRFLTVDPGEMNTRMHAEAMPDVDPAQLRDPAEVADRIVALLRAAETIPSGSRLEAMAWNAGSALRAAAS